MTDFAWLNGATRLIPILGDPIAQVKSPAGVTQSLQAGGRNAMCVPMHVAPAAFDEVVRMLGLTQNVDGFIATIPHKFSAYQLCTSASERAALLGAANVVRRNPDGTWHGDMIDGLSFVAALRSTGFRPQGKRALLAGAGGAGSAIGLALLDAGVAALAVHDADAQRRDGLIARLSTRYPGQVHAGNADPAGYNIIANATPMGMRATDPYPVDVTRFTPDMVVGDVVTIPAVPPLIAAARAAGCTAQTGTAMFQAVTGLLTAFFLETGTPAAMHR